MKHIRMSRAQAEKWLTALRSGEYKQGYCTLKDEDSYCCLGVLQVCLSGDVEYHLSGASKDIPSLTWLREKNITFTGRGNELIACPYIGDEREGLGDYLTNYNDEKKITFSEIADLLEQEIEYTD